ALYSYRVIRLDQAGGTSNQVTLAPLAGSADGITSADGRVRVILPAGLASQLGLTVAPAATMPAAPAGMRVFGSAYEVNAFSLGTGAGVHRLDQAATLSFALPAGLSAPQLAGLAV